MDIRATETVEPVPPGGDLEILPAGTLLAGRFELGRPLGWGGYAVVYEASDRELHRRIAVKVLRGERMRPSSVARMRREVAVARDVTSPRLVKLYDIGEDGPHTFITMEMVEGRSLRETIREGPIPVGEVLRIADQILEALNTLHARGIVHRDLKPANILLTPAGEVKLADFGLARHWENEEMRVTGTEGLVGTMEYLAPEQALGQELDPRSDLYAFGVVLYEMLAGALPFGAASSLGTVVAHVTTRAPDVRRVRQDAPVWLSVLIRRLLEKKREDRPGSAEEVRETLRATTIDWAYRWKKSRARVVVLTMLLAWLVAAGAWGWSHYWSRFDRIGSDSNDTLHAYDRTGRVLWSLPNAMAGARAAVASLRPGERRVFAIPRDDASVPDAAESSRPLRILDPQTGEQLGTIPIPPAPQIFPVHPAFNVVAILAVDTDHDGADELVVTYIHFYWPSYSLLVDPRTGRAAPMLFASGHHRPIGTIDVDGDGKDEVLFAGPNNRMGWRAGLAAVRAGFATDSDARALVANTPDALYADSATALAWYTLLPRKRIYYPRLARIDPATRTFDLVTEDGGTTTLTFDGFLSGSAPPEATSRRQALRDGSYAALREAQLREALGDFDAALALGRRARDAAEGAGEPELATWAATALARTHARLGPPAPETDAEVERILATTDGGPELCWEAGRAFSARGESRRAAHWFTRALTLTRGDWVGHPPADYRTEAVIALAELEAWDEALDLIDRFDAGHVGQHDTALRERAMVYWRAGRTLTDSIPYVSTLHWLHNYWALEHARASERSAPEEFLERLQRELHGVENAPWIRSIEADVLSTLGRNDEALPIAREAWEAVTADPSNATARLHRPVVEERLRRIEAAARLSAGH